MARIRIDGNTCEVSDGKNVLEACLSLGVDLPYFCWHPALGSVGACRQCAVKHFKDENDEKSGRGKIVMACMTPAKEGTLVSCADPEAKAFRASVIEWLMANHPHDCPVCDEGGECHLQDMTVMTGHFSRRFRFKKRTFDNQDLGPFVNHEMNRCIACYRCVRFYRDYAGGHDLNAFASRERVYFGRNEEGILENEFSGNLVEVCPTGVFTDKTLKRHYTRKWDLQTAPSICVHCSLGCNTLPGERYGVLRQIRNRYHREINGYFLCDRGRYGYEFVNGDRRLRDVWLRPARHARIGPMPPSGAIERLSGILRPGPARSKAIGIGSPRASIEANFALRTLVGPERFYSGLSDLDSKLVGLILDQLKGGPVPFASLGDIEQADAVLVLGEDVTQTAPRLALAIRQSVRNVPLDAARQLGIADWQDAAVREVAQDRKGPLFVAAPYRTKLAEIATQSFCLAPDEVARLGFAVAHAIDGRFPKVPDASTDAAAYARTIAQVLADAKRPAIVSGTGIRSSAVLRAAFHVAAALHGGNAQTRICLTASEANSFGVGLMDGKPISEALARIADGSAETLLVLENDLFRRADEAEVRATLAQAKTVVLLDHTATAMVPRADIILPSATFAESEGTLVNHEGRAQRFYQVFAPRQAEEDRATRESWRWLRDVMEAGGRPESRHWNGVDAVSADFAAAYPELGAITQAAPPASFRIDGGRIARQSHRYSGRTAIHARAGVHEPAPPEDRDSPFCFSMEGFQGQPPAALVPRFWAPGWNSIQSLNKFQGEVGGPLRGGPAGLRLFAPLNGQRPVSRDVPPAFTPRAGRWLAVPIHHLFGSEELSALSPGISGQAPLPYVAINPQDAARLGIAGGEPIDLTFENRVPLGVPARIEPSLPRGVIGLPVGAPGLSGRDVLLPAWGILNRRPLAGVAS